MTSFAKELGLKKSAVGKDVDQGEKIAKKKQIKLLESLSYVFMDVPRALSKLPENVTIFCKI